MSQWINKDLFNKFVEEKKNERDNKPGSSVRRSELAWRNPDRGTVDRPKTYVGRFLPDPKGQFYKKYYYHMFQIGEQWVFFLCPKTFNFENYCPWCAVNSKLWTGTKADKQSAYNYKRKEKFLSNWYVIDDPRDAEAEDEEEKASGKVKIYEFPSKVEQKVKVQVTDTTNGLGDAIFDPGENGFDFILKVGATKRDKNNKVWPDYNLSEFGRKPHPIADTEEGIKEIMSTTIDLDEYLTGMERDESDTIEALKHLMLWDLVSSDFTNKGSTEKVEDDIPSFESERVEEDTSSNEEDQVESSDEEDDNLSDSALLEELENL